jgi:NADH-quinone oxidoreductase subunit J
MCSIHIIPNYYQKNMIDLNIIFQLLVVLLSISLIFGRNPAHVLFFLILIFVSSSISMVLLGHDFIGLLFIIIYVGAISVLFLFVVMMLDLKAANMITEDFIKTIAVLALIILIFITVNDSLNSFVFLFSKEFNVSVNFLEFDNCANINAFGQCLFNYYAVCVVICGVILLVALIGSVQLCFDYASNTRGLKQLDSKQLSKSKIATISFMMAKINNK